MNDKNNKTITIVIENIRPHVFDISWQKSIKMAHDQFGIQLDSDEAITIDAEVLAEHSLDILSELIACAITAKVIMQVDKIFNG